MKNFINEAFVAVGKSMLPRKVIRFIQDKKINKFKNASIEKTFTDIYMNAMWGTGNEEFYSGSGSDEQNTYPYLDSVAGFINDNKLESLVDIGCGDFRVGNALLSKLTVPIMYTGLDIVEPLVVHNQNKYGNPTIRFQCVNAVSQNLPKADVCTIREVLQHLSNQEIAVILDKVMRAYKFALITERQLIKSPEIIPNLDKVHGPHTRVMHNSSIYLEESPFNLKVRTLLEYEVKAQDRYGKEITTIMRTYLWDAKNV